MASSQEIRKTLFQGLQFKVLATLAALFTAFVVIAFAWSSSFISDQGLNNAEEQAVALSDQMDAIWDYVDQNQPATNIYVQQLGEQARGLVCVSAVKSVARQFSRENDSEISVVSLRPRNTEDTPDEFQRLALEAFAADDTLESYSGVTLDENGERAYYYLRPRRITAACLSCHGDVAGERDALGYTKEGYGIGTVAGAISVKESLDSYTAAASTGTLQTIGLFLAGLLAFIGTMYALLRASVIQPVKKVSEAASAYRPGKGSKRIAETSGNDEIAELARDFNAMADDLDSLYSNLELRVEERTAELARLNGQLQSKQEELSEALAKLQSETAYKDQLFASLSHDLRTPLASIIAYTQLAETQSQSAAANATGANEDETVRQDRETLEHIGEQARTLVGMVDNILAFSRAEAQGIEVHPSAIDLLDLASRLRYTMEPIAAKRGLALTVQASDDLPLIEADRDLLMRALNNLVTNAAKFTPAGGSVWVRIEQASEPAEHPSMISFVVEDNGVGIAPEDLQRIFDPYTKGAYREGGKRTGAGLGLAVIRQIAEVMRGNVRAEQRAGGGSRFVFSFPATVLDEEDYE